MYTTAGDDVAESLFIVFLQPGAGVDDTAEDALESCTQPEARPEQQPQRDDVDFEIGVIVGDLSSELLSFRHKIIEAVQAEEVFVSKIGIIIWAGEMRDVNFGFSVFFEDPYNLFHHGGEIVYMLEKAPTI